MPALCLMHEYYGLGLDKIIGTSIPAAEHSTITSWTKPGELDAFRNMLTQYPKGLVAVVSDSYDIYNACKNLWGTELKQMILDREGVLVVRPDSGNPRYRLRGARDPARSVHREVHQDEGGL